MFKAITSGKAGNLSGAPTLGLSWSKAFKASEDLLTATVLERLAYLDGPLLWSILRATFPELPNYRFAELLTIEFWPRWISGSGDGQVEPDAFLRFEVGDPAKRVDLIVECKLGGLQYAEQWLREWEAYKGQVDESDDDVVGYLLALGGAVSSANIMVEQFQSEIAKARGGSIALLAIAAGWQKLADVVGDTQAPNSQQQRILDDVSEALSLFGFRHLDGIETVLSTPRLSNYSSSMDCLRALKGLKR